MNELQKKAADPQSLPVVATTRKDAIMGTLVVFNQLRGFKLDRGEAEGWMATVERLRPCVAVEALRVAVDGMIAGRLPYDEKIGIRNIFIALDRVAMSGSGKYEIVNNVPL